MNIKDELEKGSEGSGQKQRHTISACITSVISGTFINQLVVSLDLAGDQGQLEPG